MITHAGDWSLEVPPYIPAGVASVQAIAIGSAQFESTLASVNATLRPLVRTSCAMTLPHGQKFAQGPAHLQVKLSCVYGKLKVLHQATPGAAWRFSEEVVQLLQLSADGLRATIPVYSFSNRVLVEDPVGELPSSVVASKLIGGLPAPNGGTVDAVTPLEKWLGTAVFTSIGK